MTLSSTATKISHNGNGATVAFAFPYYFLQSADLEVRLVANTGAESVKALGSDYTVAGAGNPSGGTVTMAVAPASGDKLVIRRIVTLTQTVDYAANDPFPAQTHEDALDKRAMAEQFLNEKVDRALRVPVGDASTPNLLPPASARANKVLAFDADGDPVVSNEDLADIEGSIIESAASASAAATSASAAETAETNAAISAAAAAAVVGGFSVAGLALMDDADAAAQRATLDLEPGVDVFKQRSLTGTSPVQVADGDGLAGNPTISVDAATPSAVGVDYQRPITIPFHANAGATTNFTDMPPTAAFLNNAQRHATKFDLTRYTQARLVVHKLGTAGATGAKLHFRYFGSYSSTPGDYLQAGVTEISVAIDTTDTMLDSGWIDLASGAKSDKFLAIIGVGGDGAADPQMGHVHVNVR